MGALAGKSGVGESSERLAQASALRLDLRGLSLCQAPFARPEVITSEIRNRPVERQKFLGGRRVHLAGIVGHNFIKKGGDEPMG